MGVPLQRLLKILFVGQVVGASLIVGYLSFRSGQRAVSHLADQLMAKIDGNVTQELSDYLAAAQELNLAHIAALEAEAISLDRLDQLHRYLVLQHQQRPNITALSLGTPQGDLLSTRQITSEDFASWSTALAPEDLPVEAGRAYPEDPNTLHIHAVDSAGNLGRLLKTQQPVDVRQQPWYRDGALAAGPGWSAPFPWENHLAISTYAPFYGPEGQLQGVISANLSLQYLNQFLASLAQEISGEIFLMERSGLLLADSAASAAQTSIASSIAIEADKGEIIQPRTIPRQRVSADASANPLIRQAAAQLEDQFSHLSALETAYTDCLIIGDRRYFLRAAAYQETPGLDWVIVIAVPETAFTAEIQANLVRTVGFCGLALVGSIGLGIWTARRITHPLHRLSQAVQSYGQGKTLQQLSSSGISEVDSLQRTFERMATEVSAQNRKVAQFHANYEAALEQQVQERTQALRGIALQLELAQRIAQVGSWEMNVETQQLSWSAEMFHIAGYSPHRPTPSYQEVLDLLPVEDSRHLDQLVQQATAQGESYELEHCLVREDGTLRHVLSRGKALKDDSGQVIKLVGTAADITERKRMELALRRSEARLQRLATNVVGVIYQYARFADGSETFLYISPRCRDIYEYSPEEIQQNINLVWEMIHPEDLEQVRLANQRSAEQLIPFDLEFRLMPPSGVTRWVRAVSQPERQGSGGTLWDGILLDISHRKQTELSIQRSETLFRSLFEQSAIGILFCQLDGDSPRFVEANQKVCDLLGYSKAELLTRSVADITHPEDIPQGRAEIQKLTAGVIDSVSLEKRYLHRDGHSFWARVSLALIEGVPQYPRLKVVLIEDIDARKRAELELQQAKQAAEDASQAKSRFIANISHELRSPLNAILGFARLLKGSDTLSPEEQEHTAIIERSGEHLLTIINQVLDLAKVEANQTLLSPSRVDLSSLLEDLRLLFELKAEAKEITFTIQRSPALPQHLYLDEMKLRQVLINLLDNAFKFTPKGSVILSVDAAEEGAGRWQLEFAIADTGVGIAAEEQGLLFQPFSQTRSGQAIHSGTGLGLAISQEFVRLLGGQLTLESQPHRGSCFRFTVPVQVALPPAAAAAPRRVVGLQPGHPTTRLLVVDDNPVNRRLLVHLLSVLPLQVQEAENGAQALELWQRWRPHGVLMDLRMPVMSGYEAAHKIRVQEAQTPAAPATVIIAVTAAGMVEEEVPAPPEFNGYVLKPFRPHSVFAALEQLGLRYRYADD